MRGAKAERNLKYKTFCSEMTAQKRCFGFLTVPTAVIAGD